MKFLAVFLIGVLFLLPFAGTGPTTPTVTAKKMCCYKMQGSKACHSDKQQKDDCGNSECYMIMGCNLCGFLAPETITLIADHFSYIEKPALPYKIGDLTDFHSSGWQPPEV